MTLLNIPTRPYHSYSQPLSKWDVRFMSLASHYASWSKDPSTKVGSVIAKGNRPISFGYNGFPASIPDKTEWLSDRSVKYPVTIHAEHNAVLSSRESTTGATCYVWPMPPCASCASVLVQEGVNISRVVSLVPQASHIERWGSAFDLSFAIFDCAGVELVLVEECELRNSEFWNIP